MQDVLNVNGDSRQFLIVTPASMAVLQTTIIHVCKHNTRFNSPMPFHMIYLRIALYIAMLYFLYKMPMLHGPHVIVVYTLLYAQKYI